MSSIRYRILLALVVAGFVPVILILTVSQTLTRQAVEESQLNQISNLTREVSRKISNYAQAANADLRSLATNPIVSRDIDRLPQDDQAQELERKQDWFSRTVENYGQFNDIVLYSTDGDFVTSKRGSDNKGYWDGSPWLKQAAIGDPVITAPTVIEEMVDLRIPELEMLYYIPVVGDQEGEPTYVIKASLKFSGIWEALNEAQLGATRFMLLDAQDNILFCHDNSRVLREKADQFGDSNSISGEFGEDVYVRHRFRPSAQQGDWTLIGIKSKADAYQLASETTSYALLTGIASMIVAIILGLWLAGRLTSPIAKLSQATRLVAKGKLGTHIPEEGAQEMKDLARDFNQMVGDLKQHREGLESIVLERTRNLRESQEQLSDLTAQLRASYDSTQEAILVVKTDGEVLTANRRFCELFGLDGAAELDPGELQEKVGKCFLERERFADHWKRCNDSLSFVDEDEWSVVEPREMVVTIYSAPVKNASNVTFARLWMFRDLTEQRQLENGLRQAQKMEAVGRLAGGVAHDFNNLLTGIIGNLSLAQMNQEVHPEKMDHLVASAKHAGQRAAELVKQLLGFSRQSHLKLQRCAVNEIAEEVRDLLIHSIDPRIQVVLDLKEDLWAISADPNQVQQVIMNMAVNAKDAIGEVKGRVRIGSTNLEIDEFHASLVSDANPGDYVRISVEDTGSGMSAEVKANIFEPFFTTKEQGKGTGLGLATSYGIIQQHGGWISCESEEGVGTTFHIYLPRGDVNELPEVMETKKEAVKGGTETVLLVDDEPVVRMVGEGVLKHHGYNVVVAGDGEEALEIIGERGDEIAIVMLDLTMPKMSGRDTFRNLRSGDYPPIPVVVCSGYLVDLDEFAEETGAKPEGFVQKPYDSEELARTLRSVMDAAASTA